MSGQPNFLLSYLEERDGMFGPGFYLTATPTDLILMGFNDTGAPDDNHDDHMISGASRMPATKIRRSLEHCRSSRPSWAAASCSADCAIVAKLNQRPDTLT